MLNLFSLAIGAVSIVPLLFALLPFFGWANWLILPLPVAGLIVGSLSRGTAGRNLNLVILGVAAVRLVIGHGII
ncbi:MAG TPA: hypothetical protein VNT42_11110 [Sphingomonas sp.]|nr:hypothetical protein [Sphingomonas sp.]